MNIKAQHNVFKNQKLQIGNVISNYLKTGNEKNLNSAIWGNSNKMKILASYKFLHNYIGHEDTSKINVKIIDLGYNKDTSYVIFIPYLKDASPNKRKFEIYSPIHKIVHLKNESKIQDICFFANLTKPLNYNVKAEIVPNESSINVDCKFTFKIVNNIQNKIYLRLYPDLHIKKMLLNNSEVNFKYTLNNLIIEIPEHLKKEDKYI